MDLLDRIKQIGSNYNLTEEDLYDEVASEVADNKRRDGLWIKALSQCSMDEEKAKPLYIKFRVESLRDEIKKLLSELKINERNEYIKLVEAAKHDRQLAADELVKANNDRSAASQLLIEAGLRIEAESSELRLKYEKKNDDLNIKIQALEHEYSTDKLLWENKIKKISKLNNQLEIAVITLFFALMGYIIWYR